MTKEQLEKERETIVLQLQLAIESYYENPDRQSFNKMCETFTLALVYNVAIIVPTDIKNGQTMFRLRNMNSYVPNNRGSDRYCYFAYNTYEEALKTPSQFCTIMGIRPFFNRVASHSGIMGLLINPERTTKNDNILFLNKENIQIIVADCDETIKSQSFQIRQILNGFEVEEKLVSIEEMQEVFDNSEEQT